ncbi:MAG: RAMP superfamily CRISPR-associated protein [Spirosomataceae bacterium]
MAIYQIRVEPQSYLLCSNAETTSTLDSQFVFDQNGFPYFPGKTFKGLLKESMIEVLEMEGKSKEEIVKIICYFFGVEGDRFNHGKLELSNLYLKGYDDQHDYFQTKDALNKYQIQNYFLIRVQQTAIDDHEIAKDTALRTYGVLNHKKAKAFVATLELELNESQKALLERAMSNLRRAGIRRNRGFGQIKCTLQPAPANPKEPTDADIRQTEIELWPATAYALSVKITLREPTVLGTQNTDTNTVFSQNYITGSQLMGMLACAHPNKGSAEFNTLFLEDKLRFGPCYPAGAQPLPTAIHQEKYAATAIYHNILAGTSENTVTKGVGGFVGNSGKVKVEKHFNFHASRPQRSAGRSMKNQPAGGIFYYEALAKGTKFEGEITGDRACLEQLYAHFGGTKPYRLGKSKSSQYGNIEVEITPISEPVAVDTIEGDCYLVAQSPLILYNDAGYPSPAKETLESALAKKVTVEAATARVVAIEQFNSTWLTKTGKVMAFEEGSTFKVKVSEPLPTEMAIGEWLHKGFGKVRFLTAAEMDQYKANLHTTAEVPQEDTTPEKDPPAFMKEIVEQHTREKQQQALQTRAYNDVRRLNQRLGGKRLSNSLISRMQAVMKLSDAEIDAFFNESTQDGLKPFKEKPAGKALADVDLYKDLKATAITEHAYWIAFFDYLRKANNS